MGIRGVSCNYCHTFYSSHPSSLPHTHTSPPPPFPHKQPHHCHHQISVTTTTTTTKLISWYHDANMALVSNPSGPIEPVLLLLFKWIIFHFLPPFLLEVNFCKSTLVLVGFIYGSQLSGWFLVANQFIIKCFEINLNTVWNHLLESARSSLRKTISSEGPSSSLVACDSLQTLIKYG